MTLKRIIEIADKAYGDGLVKDYFTKPNENHGDTLAEFIVRELRDCYDPDGTDEDQLEEASLQMERAGNQLFVVAGELGCGIRRTLRG